MKVCPKCEQSDIMNGLPPLVYSLCMSCGHAWPHDILTEEDRQRILESIKRARQKDHLERQRALEKTREDEKERREKERKRDEQARETARIEHEKEAARIREREAQIVRECALRELEEKVRREQAEARTREEERIRKEREIREAQRATLFRQIQQSMEEDFFGSDALYNSLNCSLLIDGEEYLAKKAKFVINWAKQELDTVLDSEQAAAVAAVHGNIQVVARAGAGKTRTLVNRAAFLQKHCRIPPSEILLLAFNRDAAKEIRGRLSKHLNNSIPHAMTFHALAYALVHPEESPLHDGPTGETQDLSQAFQEVIDEHLLIPKFSDQVRKIMMAHFREDWEKLVAGGRDKSKEEMLKFRRSMPKESLRGDFVKSFGEKVIANFLFEHDVTYKYERNHWWNGLNYRPDFTIFKTDSSGVIIEYYGLAGDPDYDEMSQKKREYWAKKPGWELVELNPADIAGSGSGEFKNRLRLGLEKHGINCAPLSEEEIWQRLRKRAIDRFTKTVRGFAGRCRKCCLSPDELLTRIESHKALSATEDLFLQIAHVIYVAYLERLRATGGEDFDGLMQGAIERIESGAMVFERKEQGRGDLKRIKYIMIDEYQDFSLLFHRLTQAICKQNPAVEFFCVGDDWQAINGFAGSDLKFYEQFQSFFKPSQRLNISTNYRSAASIVDVGNVLMMGLGQPATVDKEERGRVLLCDISSFVPTEIERGRHRGDVISPLVARLSGVSIEKGDSITLLSRRNRLPWFVHYQSQDLGISRGLEDFVKQVQDYFPKPKRDELPKITISTTHKYKGREEKTVVILDAVVRSYPLIHPDWVFYRLLGESPEKITEEERRLFYVALTRAVDTLIVITEKGNYSPFLQELVDRRPIKELDWNEFPPIEITTDKRIVVKVGNQKFKGAVPTLAIKDQLRACGFQWRATGWAGWAKTFPEGFKIESLHGSIWAKPANGVEVRVYSASDTLLGRYKVDGGHWSEAPKTGLE